MEIIIHRINTIESLKNIPHNYGVEIDVRSYGNDLILNHDAYQNGDSLDSFLENYNHGTLVLNIKESGIEDSVIEIVDKHVNIQSYFLLDIEFPYLCTASKKVQKNMAIRYSEYESIQTVNQFINKVGWVWIDTFTKLPITKTDRKILDKFKKCLVCPERWNRKSDIVTYKKILKSMNFKIDAVMTSKSNINYWLKN